MVRGLGYTTPTNLGSLTCRQHHVHQLDLAQVLEDPSRLVPQSSSLTSAPASSTTHRPRSRPRCGPTPAPLSGARWDAAAGRSCGFGTRLGLGELGVGPPKILLAPLHNIAPQQVTAFAQRSPIPPWLGLLPHKARPAIRGRLDLGFKQPRRPAVLPQQPSQALRHHHRFQALLPTTGLDPQQPSSIRCSNRPCMAFSFSRRSRLRQSTKVSSPSGEGQNLTSRPSRIACQSPRIAPVGIA